MLDGGVACAQRRSMERRMTIRMCGCFMRWVLPLPVDAQDVEDFGAEFVAVELAVVTPDDFAAGGDQDCVGVAAWPFVVEGFHQGVGIGAGEEVIVGGTAFGFDGGFSEIHQSCALFFQELFGFGFILGVVYADGDQFEIAHGEFSGGGDQLGKFCAAWGAPGGPDVDEAEFFGGVFAEGGEAGVVDGG